MAAALPIERASTEMDPGSELARLWLGESPQDSIDFIETYFTVPNENGVIVPMKLYPQQKMMLADETGRDITVKGRQTRASSVKLARRVRRMCFQLRGARCLVAAQDDKTTELFRARILHHIHDLQNKGLNIKLDRENSGEIVIAGLDNMFQFVSGEHRVIGRAFATQDCHLSEIAHWKPSTLGDLLGGLLPSVPSPPYGMIDMESTPAGEEGKFHEYAMQAKPFTADDDWTVHFYPWWLEPRYRLTDDPTKGWQLVSSSQLRELTQDFTATDEEKKLMTPAPEGPGLELNQILWRRFRMREQNKTDAPFSQEYPEDILKCWVGISGRYFDTADGEDHLDYYRRDQRPPLKKFESLPWRDNPISFFGPNLEVWELPIPADSYAIAFDSAGGGIGKDYDYSSIGVWNATKEKRVARLTVQCSPKQLGAMMCAIGAFYGLALAGGERSHQGAVVFDEMKDLGYNNLFYYVDPEKGPEKDPKPGIYPTALLRQRILEEFKDGIITHAIQHYDAKLNQQMSMFTWDKHRGALKPSAERKAGSHDDVVIEAAHGWFLCSAARTRRSAMRRRSERQEMVVGRGGLLVERLDSRYTKHPWLV